MPITVFPAPGFSSNSKQFLTPFLGFDIAPKSGGTFTNFLLQSENQSNVVWTKSTGTTVITLYDGSSVVNYTNPVNNAIRVYQEYTLPVDDILTVAASTGANPVILGSFGYANTLTCTTGTWNGANITFSYQWLRSGVAITGANSSSYIISANDNQYRLQCLVYGTNSDGTGTGYSNLTQLIVLNPANTVAPLLTGNTTVTSVLSVTSGTWASDTVLSYKYQWQRSGTNISASTATTYTIVNADMGSTLACLVTATDTRNGSTTATSNATAIISGTPVNLSAPVVFGTAIVGQSLGVLVGSWYGYPAITYTYQWQRNSVNISAATSTYYTLVSADDTAIIRCVVTATNTVGSTQAISNSTAAVQSYPTNIVIPAITGTTYVGQTLYLSTGTWTGTAPIAYSYVWKRGGILISGATGTTYLLKPADATYSISGSVTAANSIASVTADSTATAIIIDQPTNTVAPLLTGTAISGQTLSVTSGTWTAAVGPIVYSYQWVRGSTPVAGSTASTYVLSDTDVGNSMYCNVTGSNVAGSRTANSNASSTVLYVAPVNTVAPLVTGTATVGQVLSVSNGIWTSTPTPTYAYQWYRGSTATSGATASTYTLVFADATYQVSCYVTADTRAFNGQLSSPAQSNATRTVDAGAAPQINFLVVGGGGAGGGYGVGTTRNGGSGGGGGASVIWDFANTTPGQQYLISIGAGGLAATGSVNASGNPSSISGFSGYGYAGGYGGNTGFPGGNTGPAAGTGGGGGDDLNPTTNQSPGTTGGVVNTNSGTFVSNSGGFGRNFSGGGGGGAGAAGLSAAPVFSTRPDGGNGLTYPVNGVTYGGGGGGGYTSQSGGLGGSGGGGVGAASNPLFPSPNAGQAGTPNTGGGGGGSAGIRSQPASGGNGGSGVIVIAYPAAYRDATTTGTVTVSTGTNKIYTFTAAGSIKF